MLEATNPETTTMVSLYRLTIKVSTGKKLVQTKGNGADGVDTTQDPGGPKNGGKSNR